MRVALYLRRSTEEHQADSIDTQRDRATAWCAARSWSVVAEYVDSGISRTDFSARRRGWFAMKAGAAAGAFDVVVTRDVSRIGGNIGRALVFVEELLDTGVRMHCYADSQEVTGSNALQCVTMALKFFGAQTEVEHIRSRTRDALLTKAQRGLVAGGAVYGYSVEAVEGGKAWRVVEAEAEVVREIFRRYAAGDGLRTIAKDLNARRVAPPRAGKRGTGSWSYSSIREMLRRDRYRGTLVWGKTAKVQRGESRGRVDRPESEWVTIDVPELRIVPEDLWTAVRRREEPRARTTGSTARGAAPRYLLSGIGRCGECGGPMRVDNAKVSNANVRVYGCSWHRDRGAGACSNGLRRPVSAVDHAVLGELVARVLRTEVITATLAEVRRQLAAETAAAAADLPKLERQAAALRLDIDGLVEAMTAAPAAARKALLPRVADRQTRLDQLEARLAAARAASGRHELALRRAEAEAKGRLADLRGLLTGSPEGARRVLEAVLGGPLRFVPTETGEGKRYVVEGTVALAGLAVGEQPGAVPLASPAGNARISTALLLPWRAVA